MHIWRIVCATLVIFVAGIATGVVLVRLGERSAKPWNRPIREVANPPNRPGNPDLSLPPDGSQPNGPAAANNFNPLNRQFVPVLDRQLGLSPEQREKIQRVMKTSQERIKEMRLKIEPEIRAEMRKAHEQIQAVLTPEQQKQYQRLMKRQLRRNEGGPADRQMREPRPRGPLPPPGEENSTDTPPLAPAQP